MKKVHEASLWIICFHLALNLSSYSSSISKKAKIILCIEIVLFTMMIFGDFFRSFKSKAMKKNLYHFAIISGHFLFLFFSINLIISYGDTRGITGIQKNFGFFSTFNLPKISCLSLLFVSYILTTLALFKYIFFDNLNNRLLKILYWITGVISIIHFWLIMMYHIGSNILGVFFRALIIYWIIYFSKHLIGFRKRKNTNL